MIVKVLVGHQNDQGIWCHGPSAGGGVSVRIYFRNPKRKPIQCVYFSMIAYDKEELPQACAISGKSEVRLKYKGPCRKNVLQTGTWYNVWYSRDIATAKLFYAQVEYRDGTTVTLGGQELEPHRPRGCYVATCVYGSYDCPPVWVLRRFRDQVLGLHWYGRALIGAYYALSPGAVRLFGKTRWFRQLWKGFLDRLVRRLRQKGFQDGPYEDWDW